MDIFNNDHEVLTLGGLNIENRIGQVVIYGDLTIVPDEVGREHAQVLAQFFAKLAEATKTTDGRAFDGVMKSSEEVENPFLE